MRDGFMEYTRNVQHEISCAVDANPNDDSCRTQETSALFSAWSNTARVRVSGLSGKIVATCENGQWTMPSHQCLCEEELLTRNARTDPFLYQCEAVIDVSSEDDREQVLAEAAELIVENRPEEEGEGREDNRGSSSTELMSSVLMMLMIAIFRME